VGILGNVLEMPSCTRYDNFKLLLIMDKSFGYWTRISKNRTAFPNCVIT